MWSYRAIYVVALSIVMLTVVVLPQRALAIHALEESILSPGGLKKPSDAALQKHAQDEMEGPGEDDEAIAMKRHLEAETHCGTLQYKYPTPSVARCESCKAVVRLVHFMVTKLHLNIIDMFDSTMSESNVCGRLAAVADYRQYTNGMKFWDISRALVRERDRAKIPMATGQAKFTERVTRAAAHRLLESKEVRNANGMHFYVDNDIYSPLPLSGRMEFNMGDWERNTLGNSEPEEGAPVLYTQSEHTFALLNREAVPLTMEEGDSYRCTSYILKDYCDGFIGENEDDMEQCVEKYDKEDKVAHRELSTASTKNKAATEAFEERLKTAETKLYGCLIRSCERRKGACDTAIMPKVIKEAYDHYLRMMAEGGEIGSNVNPSRIPYVGDLEKPYVMVRNPYFPPETPPLQKQQQVENEGESKTAGEEL